MSLKLGAIVGAVVGGAAGFALGGPTGAVAGAGYGASLGAGADAAKDNARAMQNAANASASATIEAAKIYTQAAEAARVASEKAAQTRREEDIAAANEAAAVAENALLTAIPQIEAEIQSGADQSNTEFANALGIIRQGLQPYMQTGTAANERLNAMMFGSADERKNAFQTDPGYESRLKQGAQTVERSAAAHGGLFSGKTGVELQEYGQDYASSEFNNAFNRLMTLSTQGQGATNTMGGYEWQGAGLRAGNAQRVSDTRAGNQQNLANMRGANAWNVANITQGGNAALMDTRSRGAWEVAGATGQGAQMTAGALSDSAYTNANAQMAKNNIWPNIGANLVNTAVALAPVAGSYTSNYSKNPVKSTNAFDARNYTGDRYAFA